MAFVFLASPGLSGRNEGSRTTHRSRLNKTSSFDDCTEDTLFRDNIYGSSSCESYNEYFSSASEYEPPVNFYISEEDEGYNEKPARKSKPDKKRPSAYRSSSGPTFLLPPVRQWSEDTYNNNPSEYIPYTQENFSYLAAMTKDGISPFSSNCDTVHLENSPLDEGGATSSPPGACLGRLQEAGKAKPLKAMIRAGNWGPTHSIRKQLWLSALEPHENKEDLFTEEDYWSQVEHIFGSKDIKELNRIEISKKHMENSYSEYLLCNYHLNEKGIQACCRVVLVLLELRSAVDFCPMLYPIAALLLHYMEEVDAFKCLDRMLTSNTGFLTKTKVAKKAAGDGLISLAARYERTAYNKLAKITVPDRDQLFVEWDKWIFYQLPFPILLRLMDCYFCEGIKVLYRACLVLFNICMKDIADNPITGSALTTDGFAKAMALFLPQIKKTPKQFLSKCFKIRNFSSKEIARIIADSTDSIMDHDQSMENAPVTANEMELEPLVFSPRGEANIQASTIATLEQFQQIWNHVPIRIQLCSPTLIFTTEEHGSSLNTLYRLTDMLAPFLILIKDQNDHVFGAYCSHPLRERHAKDEYQMRQTFFGNGETFVFSLKPVFRPFKWVGLRMQSEGGAKATVDRVMQQFMHADNEDIMIGGGHSCAAIQIDKDLSIGTSSHCPTFDSPPLSLDTDFEIRVLEIYSILDLGISE